MTWSQIIKRFFGANRFDDSRSLQKWSVGVSLSDFLTIEPSVRHEGKQIQPASFELRWRTVGRKLVGRQMGRDRWAEHELAEVRRRSRVTARREAHRRADADKSAVNLGLTRSLADQRSVQRRHKDHLFELHMAVEASEKEHQLRCARALIMLQTRPVEVARATVAHPARSVREGLRPLLRLHAVRAEAGEASVGVGGALRKRWRRRWSWRERRRRRRAPD